MKRLSILLILGIFAAPLAHAATVVTQKEKITGTIVSQSEAIIMIKQADGKPIAIQRKNVLQILDDKGELVWQAGQPAAAPQPATAAKPGEPLLNFAAKSVILDFFVGTSLGGFYSEENRFIDALGIYMAYADGSRQSANTGMLQFGLGVNYQSYDSARWSWLFSYLYRSTQQNIRVGDGKKYENKTLADSVVTTFHGLMFGREVHFYPGDGGSSFDFTGQVGYEFGNYAPLASYNSVRTQLSPVPPLFNVPGSVTVHGPTARIGTGFTFRGTNWQLKLFGYYQIAYTFASEQIWTAVPKNTVLHDVYGGVAVGYGF